MWTSFFMEMTPEEAIGEIGRLGWGDADLSTEHGLALVERGNPEAAGREFRRHADSCGVRVAQGHLDLFVNIAPAHEADRRRAVEGLKPWLDVYAAAAIANAVIHPGRGLESGDAKHPEAVLKSLGELLDHARGSPLVFCIENCKSAEAVRRLLDATDPASVAACLDTGHLNLTDENPAAFIRWCGARLRALHLAENDKSGDQHNMPFARGGTVPWVEIADALREVRYSGTLNYEIPGERACPLDIRRLKMDYLKRVSEWLFCGLD